MDFGVIDVEEEYDAAAGSADFNAGQPLGLGIGAVQFLNDGDGLVRSPNTRKNKRPKQPCNHLYIYIYIYTYIQLYAHYLSPNILKLLPDLPTSSRSSSSRRVACATRPAARAKSKLTRAKSCAYQPFGLPLGVELSLMTCDMPRKNGSFNRENVDHHQIWR